MTDTIEVLKLSRSGELFEGPAWDARLNELYWVDITQKKVFSWNGLINRLRVWCAPESCSAAIPVAASRNSLIIPGMGRLWVLDTVSGVFKTWMSLDGEPRYNRCNDSKCDPIGMLWVGTMDDNEKEICGAHWRVSEDGRAVRKRRGLGVANTWCWDEVRKRVYWADSKSGNIFVSDYYLDNGGIAVSEHSEVFVSSSYVPGVPDGSAIDMEGNIWNARWGCGLVIGFDPNGREIKRFSTGWKYPTSCAFYGQDLQKLAVTCASSSFVEPDLKGSIDPKLISAGLLSLDTGTSGANVELFGADKEMAVRV